MAAASAAHCEPVGQPQPDAELPEGTVQSEVSLSFRLGENRRVVRQPGDHGFMPRRIPGRSSCQSAKFLIGEVKGCRRCRVRSHRVTVASPPVGT